MAQRPVFVVDPASYVKTEMTEFTYYQGFAKVQRQRSYMSLHSAFAARHPGLKILEISSFSQEALGNALSAFNLTLLMEDGRHIPVEQVYQAGKVFEHGGPFTDLLDASPSTAKKDPRLSTHGRITSFYLDGHTFPTEPSTLFYTWLYFQAVHQHPYLSKQLVEYDAFTDIVYNPDRSVSCQAKSAALYVALVRKNELERALEDQDFLARILFNIGSPSISRYK